MNALGAVRQRIRHRDRLVGFVRILLLFESALYSAVTPVLPHYARVLHASKPAVGLLAAAYTAGLIPGALLAGWAAGRIGVRRTTMLGLGVFAVAVAAFGFGSDLVALDGLRVVQGIACGGIWGGALTWVIAVTPRQRRGAVIGSVVAAATFGTLLGPLLGTLAVTAGTAVTFTLVGVLALALMLAVLRHPEPARAAHREDRPEPWWRQLRRGGAGLALGTWLISLEAMTIGAVNALLPLRLARFGASSVLIGGAFLGASALGTALATGIGTVTDRRGPRLPLCVGLAASGVLMPLLGLPQSVPVLVALLVIGLGGPLAGYIIPAMSLMTETAERAGLALVLVTTLFNLAYAAGETFGAPVAALASQASSDVVPLLALSLLMLLTLIPARRVPARALTAATAGANRARTPEPAPEPRPDRGHATPV